MSDETTTALIVAAGRGTRAGAGMPKQYRLVGGVPVLTHTLMRLLSAPSLQRVLCVIHPEDAALYAAAAPDDSRLLPPVFGGAERTESVRLGLEALAEDPPSQVLIHDAARPFVPVDVIEAVVGALSSADGALAALPVVDALWHGEAGRAGAALPREHVWRAQTPQGFRYSSILSAYRAHTGRAASDDVEIARAAGLDIQFVQGHSDGFKITTGADFDRAERLARMTGETRVGQGYDVHAFTDGSEVILCGIALPFEKSLSGHSDADVAMHALTDALFGALAEGDIGRWFPPSEPEWKGAASSIFLEKAMERVRARGGRVSNADVTIICEAPKIGPHAAAMQASLARIMGVEVGRISVKATTSERLGFTGRGEGIAAMATATVVLP